MVQYNVVSWRCCLRIFDVPFLFCCYFVQGSLVLDRAFIIMPDHQSDSLVKKVFRSRLKADTSLGVADLMSPFQSWFEHNECRDVYKLLTCPLDMDWKSIPQQKWLVKNKELFSSLLAVAPNTMITSRKLKEALSRLNDEKTINYSKKENFDLWDWVDTKVRIGCAQLRELKSSPTTWERCMKRSTQTEKDVLKSMMDQIELGKDSQETQESQEQDEENKTLSRGEKGDDGLRMIVPFVAGGTDDDEKKKKKTSNSSLFTPPGHAKTSALQTPECSSGSSMVAKSPAHVFAGILASKTKKKKKHKKGDDPDKGHLFAATTTSSSIEATPEKRTSSGTRRNLEPQLDEEATSAEEAVEDKKKKDLKRKEVPLIILAAGRRIINSKTKGRGEDTAAKRNRMHDEDSIETSQEGPSSSQQGFLSSVLDAALVHDDEEQERYAKKEQQEHSMKDTHAKRKEKEYVRTSKEHALTEVGLGAVPCYSFVCCVSSFSRQMMFETKGLAERGVMIVSF